MPLPPGFLEELRARTPIAQVIGRRVRLTRSGRNAKGCCPFHGEKTPSFHVYEDHFHCFGCGAHGDAISFVMQSEGSGFMEAVTRLAGEAGLEVPKATPQEAAAEKRRIDLADVLARAEAAFRRRLQSGEGRAGLDYLRSRGLTDQTIASFGLGWSGSGRGALVAELARDGISADLLLEAGLLRETEDGQKRELFYDRVMFPIRDRTGRTISFGGRTLGDAPPKYVNGPETALFSKRRSLYGLDLAREAVRSNARLVVVEGYMDVIALAQAGIGGAVAPLGTALTEEQLEQLWRLSPVPVLCFDGDKAGARAALRAALLALPLLTPERSLSVLSLPAGEDPDSYVRRVGAAQLRSEIENARGLSDALYGILAEDTPQATPEQRAAFRTRLVETAGSIRDRALAGEYRAALLDRFFAARRTGRGAPRPVARPAPVRSQQPGSDATAERLRILVAILLHHPGLLHDLGEAFASLDLPPPWAAVRNALIAWADEAEMLDSAAALTHLRASGLAAEAARAVAAFPVPLPACAAPDAMPAEAEAGWWHIFGLLNRGRLEEEVAMAKQAFAATEDEAGMRRLIALRTAYQALQSGESGLEADA